MEQEIPNKRRAGRPRRDEAAPDMRQNLLDAAITLLRTKGAEYVTVRNVCEQAGVSVGTYYHYFRNKDDLLTYFVSETAYGEIVLTSPMTDLAGRMIELWSYLLRMYQSLGVAFTRSYYNCDNPAISAYRMAEGDHFQAGSLLERCRQELVQAKAAGVLTQDAAPFSVAADLCDIVKGCIFEWCLCRGDMPLEDSVRRIMGNYLRALTL